MKGFAVQILSSENNKLDRICEDILAKNYDAYFWDGDFFREDSFTRVIRDIFLVELPKGKSVTAFKSMDKASFVTAVDYIEIELDKTKFFSFGHANAQLPNFASIAVIPLSIPTANVDTLFYAKLGQLALNAVLAQSPASIDIWCIGGGSVVSAEFLALKARDPASTAHITCYINDIKRVNSAGNLEGTLVRPFGVCSVSELFFVQAYPEAVDGRLSGKTPTAVLSEVESRSCTGEFSCESMNINVRQTWPPVEPAGLQVLAPDYEPVSASGASGTPLGYTKTLTMKPDSMLVSAQDLGRGDATPINGVTAVMSNTFVTSSDDPDQLICGK